MASTSVAALMTVSNPLWAIPRVPAKRTGSFLRSMYMRSSANKSDKTDMDADKKFIEVRGVFSDCHAKPSTNDAARAEMDATAKLMMTIAASPR